MITTKKISLTSKQFFKLLINIYIKKRWWVFLWIWISIVLLLGLQPTKEFEIFLVFFLVLFQILLVFNYWRYSHSKKNKIFFLERYYEIDNEKIIGIIEDGTTTTVRIEHFIKVIKIKGYYLLYLSQSQFLYIPNECFNNRDDQDWFENEIISRISK